MSIEMTPKPRRELILDAVSDLATDPLNYHQKEDDYLPRGAIGKTFEAGEHLPGSHTSRPERLRLRRLLAASVHHG